MNIKDHRSQFVVHIFMMNLDLAASVKVALSQAGYEVFLFQDGDTFEHSLKQNPPHLIVFATADVSGSLSDFIEKIRNQNDEARFVVLGSDQQFAALAQYNDFGLEDIVSVDGSAMDQRVLWAVDRTCEKIYLKLQNEQLFDDWKKAQDQNQAQSRENEELSQRTSIRIESLQSEMAHLQKRIEDQPAAITLTKKIAALRSSQSKEEMIRRFLDQTAQPAVFFKFLPTVGSFVATHSFGFDAHLTNGIGSQLSREESKNILSQLSAGIIPDGMLKLLRDAFRFDPAKVLPLYSENHLEGILTFSAESEASVAELTENFSLFSLAYSNFSLEKRIDSLEVQDFVTEVFNKRYYQKALHEEFERARRMRQPLTVVKLALDNFFELESALGDAVRDQLLKGLASVITRTSRLNDVTCRTQMNEFSLILPQCSKKGASLRAERLRRIVESTPLVEGVKLASISLGVSEFPTMCSTPEQLDQTASKALLHIIEKGGNKICLFKAPSHHTPEFEVPAE